MLTRAEVERKYNECLKLAQNPELSPDLYNVQGMDAIRNYYSYWSEALGWVLDRWPDQETTSGEGL